MIKRTEQVRYLLMSLKEAYSKFVEQHPDVKVGLTKFCTLRPANVKLFDHIPHHACVRTHVNIRLLLALKEHTSLACEFREFFNQVTRDSSEKICKSSDCADCKHLIDQLAPTSPAATVSYQQWQNTDKFEKSLYRIRNHTKQRKDFLIHTIVKWSTHGKFDSKV